MKKLLSRVASAFRNATPEAQTQSEWEKQLYTIPRGRVNKLALAHPLIRRRLIDLSIMEDEENSYYTLILNTICEDCCGAMPIVFGGASSQDQGRDTAEPTPFSILDDAVEDKWLEWGSKNQIGTAIREARRGAAKSGIGILIPYKKDTQYGIKLGFRAVCASQLCDPPMINPREERIFGGIKYDENWEVESIFIRDEIDDPFTLPEENIHEYNVKRREAIVWGKTYLKGLMIPVPECAQAFTIYPSLRRYINSVVAGEEFRATMPLAIELDPTVYPNPLATGTPTGTFEYEPNTVHTLPPGTSLSSIPASAHAEDRVRFMRMMIGAAAACKRMPVNIAFLDSSEHNMASGQLDTQPWVNQVKIDRQDFYPVVDTIFDMWYERATLATGYLPRTARRYLGQGVITYPREYRYDRLFNHPDPAKVANARDTDLKSGATTLTKIYSELLENPRRAIQREAELLGISVKEYQKVLLMSRLEIKNATGQDDDRMSDSKEDERRRETA